MIKYLIIYRGFGIENVGVFEGVDACAAAEKAIKQWGLALNAVPNCSAAPLEDLQDGWSFYK